MELTYLGHSSFRIKGKKTSIVTDPFDPSFVGIKFPKVEAEIVTLSHDHGDHNKSDLVSGVRKIVSGVGEYEVSGVSIIGFPSFHDKEKGVKRGKNTIYLIEMDGVRLVHLGDLGHTLGEEIVNDLGHVDVLMVPVGGEYTIGPSEAVTVVKDIEPRLIIPMHFGDNSLNKESFENLAAPEEFLSQVGIKSEKMPKLKIDSTLSEEQLVVLLTRKDG